MDGKSEKGDVEWTPLSERISALEKRINEYSVIDSELSSLPSGRVVYTRQTSGRVFFKADQSDTHSRHKHALEQCSQELARLKEKLPDGTHS